MSAAFESLIGVLDREPEKLVAKEDMMKSSRLSKSHARPESSKLSEYDDGKTFDDAVER